MTGWDCPNLRYQETKRGGFLGFGAEGFYYCSCTNAQLDYNYKVNVCSGHRKYMPGDNMNYVQTDSNGRPWNSPKWYDCNNIRMYGFRN